MTHVPPALRRAHLPCLSKPAAILLVLATAACSPASAAPSASPGPSGAPTSIPTPTATPETGAIDHPTGATDVLLRLEQGGGFVPIDFFATNAPIFTLYGDGTVVFRDPTATPPEPAGNVRREIPFQIVRLGEDGIQAMLADALERGGLGIAAEQYVGQGADIPTTTFTITAGGGTKSVSVTGLMPDIHPGNALIVGALAALAQRLASFGAGIAGEQPYLPAAYRGVLMTADQAFGPVVAWPWPKIAPDEFVKGENEFFLTRSLSPADVGALEIPGVEGGLSGLYLQKDGKLYSFSLRPLFPDETA